MKRLIFACILYLGLIATSVWLISNPVLAGSATAKCRDGRTITCSGSMCNSQDWTESGSGDGWCNCQSSSGNDSKNCATGGGGGILIE